MNDFIPISVDIFSNPKILIVSEMTGLSVDETVSKLIRLWTHTFKQHPDGDVTDFVENEFIERAVLGFRTKSSGRVKPKKSDLKLSIDDLKLSSGDLNLSIDDLKFSKVLVHAGLIDNENGRYVIHDWYDNGGRLHKKRKYDREYKQLGWLRRGSDGEKDESKNDGNRTNSNGIQIESKLNSNGSRTNSSARIEENRIEEIKNNIAEQAPPSATPDWTCPTQQIFNLYNEVCAPAGCVRARWLNDNRRRAILAAWKQNGRRMSYFEELFKRAAESDFLTGKERSASFGFDWITKPANAIKILEGNYVNRKNRSGGAIDISGNRPEDYA